MENAIIIYPNNEEETSLYKQLAKRLNNKFVTSKNEVSKREKQFLNSLRESINEMKLYQEGKLNLKTIEEVLDEL